MKKLLQKWNSEVVHINSSMNDIFGKSQGILFEEASSEKILACETRLSTTLPESFKTFLSITNGILMIDSHPSHTINFSTTDINWLVNLTHIQEMTEAWLNGLGEEVFTPDAKYLIYGKDQDEFSIRTIYFKKLLVIGTQPDGGNFFALNPEVKCGNGEWEVWDFTTHSGIVRYRSFSDFLQVGMMTEDINKYTKRSRAF